jgi:23S rRNA (uracil1939-C5)-methyltransferase
MKASGLPAYNLKSHEGFWRFLMLRHSFANDQWMVNVITAENKRALVEPLARQLTDRYTNIVSVVNNVTSRKAGVAVGEYEIPLAGSTVLRDKIGRFEFEISSNSFFQTNTAGAAHLYEAVRSSANLKCDESVLELIESALADARNNCRINNIDNCSFISGDIKDGLSGIAARPDVIIIDPPRVGMHKDVLNQILAIAPEKIVYVSCNPATFARDLAQMKEQYHIGAVQPVDMFPHTYHIEAVVRLEKK